jgi:hypothetical protein
VFPVVIKALDRAFSKIGGPSYFGCSGGSKEDMNWIVRTNVMGPTHLEVINSLDFPLHLHVYKWLVDWTFMYPAIHKKYIRNIICAGNLLQLSKGIQIYIESEFKKK